MEEPDIHSGHRNRIKQEFLKYGYDETTSDEKVLEHLLFYCVTRKDTVPIVNELLLRFRNIAGVIDAPISELIAVSGITENAAILFKLVLPIARIYNYQKGKTTAEFNSLEQIGNYILNKYTGCKTERLSALGMDALGRKLFFEFLSDGSIESVGLSIRTVLKVMLEKNASAVVLAHNHPGGVAIPSTEDIFSTFELASALRKVGLKLLDHIIIADGDYVSMRQSKNLCEIFTNPNLTAEDILHFKL